MMILGLFGVFVLGVAFYSTGRIANISGSYKSLVDGDEAAGLALARASREFQTARANVAELAIANTPTEVDAVTADLKLNIAGFTRIFDDAASFSSAHAGAITALKGDALAVFNNGCAQTILDATNATATAAVIASQQQYLSKCAPLFRPITLRIIAQTDALVAEIKETEAALVAQTHHTILTTYAGIIAGLIVIGLIGFVGARISIIRPLKDQLVIMGRLAKGDYDAEVSGADRRDEVGAIARAVEVFRDGGRANIRLEAEGTAQRGRAEEERARAEAHRDASAKQSAAVVESLAGGLEKLSGGDLLFRLGTPFSVDYEKLRSDFNAAMDKMQETMKAIAATTQGVRSGSGEITQASDDLSRRTEQQAASLEETAAALDEITATVRKTAENASEARTTVSSAKSDAERSGVVVGETVTAMSEIEASSKQIGNIIGVIDEIAFQTNLLALNAGVEAARAGEAGRGFAVVATEVRALAQRSADAAKEIKTLISASGRQVETGVRLVGETGKSLERIVEQVARLNGLIADIAASAGEQATGLAQVNTAVNQMDQVTQQNAAMVEQATAASHSLAGEAESLGRLVGQFKIGVVDETPAAVGARRPASAAKAAPPSKASPRPASSASAARASQPSAPAPASAPAARRRAGGAALAEASEDWNEF
ncbi:MAG: HAMP domain-containing protein [Proteobacteria bacterium]|nr:HAMP domain-containing protein [Pseudomonadota bacterium]